MQAVLREAESRGPSLPSLAGTRALRVSTRSAFPDLLLTVGLLLTATFGSSAAAAVADPERTDALTPRAVVAQTLDEVLAVLKNADLAGAERKERIEQIAYAHFDFLTMSKLVLARNWRRLSDDQKDVFIREFKVLLSRSYGSRLDRWGDEKFEIGSERVEPRGDVTVKTQIVGGGFDGTEIAYRLRKSKTGQWRAIDVVAEGVSLLSSYRSQFRDAMANSGPEGLIEQMKQKNARPVEEDDATQTAEGGA